MSRMSKKFFGTVSGVASVALASSSLTFANPPKEETSQSLTDIKEQVFSDNPENNKIGNEHQEDLNVMPERDGEFSNGNEAAAVVGGIFITIVLVAAFLKPLITMARYG